MQEFVVDSHALLHAEKSFSASENAKLSLRKYHLPNVWFGSAPNRNKRRDRSRERLRAAACSLHGLVYHIVDIEAHTGSTRRSVRFGLRAPGSNPPIYPVLLSFLFFNVPIFLHERNSKLIN